MKTILIAIICIFSITAITSQQKSIDTQKSTLHWDAQKVTGEHNGTISFKSGQIQYKGDELTSATFFVDMTSITCSDIENEEYNKKLVGHLKSDDFFGVEKFPTASLVFTNVKSTGKNSYEVTADLTIKDKTNAVTFDMSIYGNKATANVKIDRTKFDVRYGSTSFFDDLQDKAIYDEFDLISDLEF